MASVMTAMQWAVEAWNDITVATIKYCWKHTKILRAPELQNERVYE